MRDLTKSETRSFSGERGKRTVLDKINNGGRGGAKGRKGESERLIDCLAA